MHSFRGAPLFGDMQTATRRQGHQSPYTISATFFGVPALETPRKILQSNLRVEMKPPREAARKKNNVMFQSRES